MKDEYIEKIARKHAITKFASGGAVTSADFEAAIRDACKNCCESSMTEVESCPASGTIPLNRPCNESRERHLRPENAQAW